MTSYYKPTTQMITETHYRKYIAPTEVLVEDEDEPIPGPFIKIVEGGFSDLYPRCRKGRISCEVNHPLVKGGEAYWMDRDTICKGYELPNNIFRPIFNYSREKQAFKVREYITKFVKIHVTHARRHLYKQELMKLHNKKIPVEIIEHISNYAWDIMLLL